MNLVNELQVSAEQDDVLTVLRKTMRLASKLGRDDISAWLEAEQSGYPDNRDVPEYRKVGTTLAYKTNGYIPAGYGQLMNGVEDLPSLDVTCPMPVRESISVVLTWIESLGKGHGIYFPIPAGSDYNRSIRTIVRFNPTIERQITLLIHLNESQIRAIPDRIKDKVLQWSLALERAGVTGEGMTFSAKDKEIAQRVTWNIYGSHIEQLNNSGINWKGSQ